MSELVFEWFHKWTGQNTIQNSCGLNNASILIWSSFWNFFYHDTSSVDLTNGLDEVEIWNRTNNLTLGTCN